MPVRKSRKGRKPGVETKELAKPLAKKKEKEGSQSEKAGNLDSEDLIGRQEKAVERKMLDTEERDMLRIS